MLAELVPRPGASMSTHNPLVFSVTVYSDHECYRRLSMIHICTRKYNNIIKNFCCDSKTTCNKDVYMNAFVKNNTVFPVILNAEVSLIHTVVELIIGLSFV